MKNRTRQSLPSSGYTQVDKIGNEDLFPEEGYAFPQYTRQKGSRNYNTSTLFPLNPEINSCAISNATTQHRQAYSDSEDIGIKPPTPIKDPPLPKVSNGRRSKLIYESVINTRKQQIMYNEKVAEYKENTEKDDASLINEELRICKELERREREEKRRNERALADSYQQQIQSREDRKSREKQEMQAYEEQCRLRQKKELEEERKKQEKQKAYQKELRADFEKKNSELQQSKQNKIVNDLEEEKRIQGELEETETRMAERAAEDERRRLEKTRMRACVCDAQAKNLAKIQSKNETQQMLSESASAKNEQKRLLATFAKREQMQAERHEDWIKLQKEKEAKKRSISKKPFPSRTEEIDEEAYDIEQKKKEAKMYKEMQAQQIKKREEEEKKMKMISKEEDKKMAEITQKKFEQSIEKLQKLVPSELGITVPKYQQTNYIQPQILKNHY